MDGATASRDVTDWPARPGPALSDAERRRLFAQHLADRRVPEGLCVNRDGRVAFTVRAAEAGQSTLSVWTTDAGAAPRRLGPRTTEVVDAPCWSADGSELAVAVSSPPDEGSRIVFVDAASGDVRDSNESIAARVETIMWVDSATVLALCAEPGSDSVVTSGAVRYAAASKRQRPRVTRPGSGRRQLYQWSPGRRPRAVGPRDGSVWDAARCGDHAVVVWSADPSESGWYDSVVAVLDLDSGELRPIYTPQWQLSPLATAVDHRRVVFVEGWSSDRGKVCGDVRVVDVDTAEVIHVPSFGVDVVQVAWRSPTSVWFAGWSGMAATWGWVGLDGQVGLRRSDDLKPGTFAFPDHEQAEVWAVSDPRDGSAPDVAVVAVTAADRAPAAVRTVTRLSRGTLTQFGSVETHPISWTATDGLRIDGVLVVPSVATAAPLVVYAHGGPANLWSTSLSPETRYLVDAGFAVLLANPRGSVGRGQDYARANLGDPAGGELGDLVAGIDACAIDGVDTTRVAIVGGSYGGYLAACGAAMTDRFACAVMMFGHPDLLSARYGSNNPAFYDKLLLGDPSSGNAASYVERSAMVHVSPTSAPTLLIHGGEDRCCPVGQAEEMYRALAERQVDTELVIYPEEGHGLHGIDARTDCWARTVTWLNRYLVGRVR